jgi:hypothetical protein
MLVLISNDVESILKDDKNFLNFCPEWRNVACVTHASLMWAM